MKPQKKSITYDPNGFIIFGNSDLRLKTHENSIFSNFGVATGFYDAKGKNASDLLGVVGKNQAPLVSYECYQLFFENA